jgi:hypothetical protein
LARRNNRYCRPDKRNKLPRWVQAASHADGTLRNENLSTAEAVTLARAFYRASAQPLDPAVQRSILLSVADIVAQRQQALGAASASASASASSAAAAAPPRLHVRGPTMSAAAATAEGDSGQGKQKRARR